MDKAFPIDSIDYTKLSKIIFISDLFRVDDREKDRIPNPQRMNVDWIYNLINPKIERFTTNQGVCLGSEKLLGDEGYWQSLRVSLYRQLAFEMNSDNWASLYSGENHYPAIHDSLQSCFDDSLVIGFELPPYLIKLLMEKHVPYVDLMVHPVRFLPDYMFGIRTNVKSIAGLLQNTRTSETLIFEHADVLRAQSSRMFDAEIKENSVLFLGQLNTDASLIAGNGMVSFKDIETNLINLCLQHEHVYYKKHPHLIGKAEKQVRSLVDSIKNCYWLDANVYDALGADNFCLVTALSSGGLVEAEYFGKKTLKLLDSPEKFATEEFITPQSYVPIYEHALRAQFWEDLIKGCTSDAGHYQYQYQGELLKNSLNIRWGK